MRCVGYTNCCLYRVDLPDDEQQACSKHVEASYGNKLIVNSASCWFILYGYIGKHGQQKKLNILARVRSQCRICECSPLDRRCEIGNRQSDRKFSF